MARARLIWPEIWSSSQFVALTPNARLLFIGLLGFCDDAGRHADDPLRMKLEVFAFDALGVEDVNRLLDEIVEQNLLLRYEVNGEGYLQVTGWNKYQKIRFPTYRYPAPDGTMPAEVPPRERPGARQSPSKPREKRESKAFVKPTVEEIAAYCKERKNGIDPERFFDFYEAKGWMVSGDPMTDWKSKVRDWEKNERNTTQPQRHEEIVYKS